MTIRYEFLTENEFPRAHAAFACYDLQPDSFVAKNLASSALDIRVLDKPGVQAFKTQVDWQPSWEHSFAGMDRIPDTLVRLGAFSGDQCVGLLVFYPLLRWVMSLVVIKTFRRQRVASTLLKRLMAELPEGVNTVKINNINKSDRASLAFFEKAGAEWVIDQFEMEYRLKEKKNRPL